MSTGICPTCHHAWSLHLRSGCAVVINRGKTNPHPAVCGCREQRKKRKGEA